jgi:hypothetical protein
MGLIECFIEIMIFMRGSMSMENLKDLEDIFGHVEYIMLDFGKMERETDLEHNLKRKVKLENKVFGKMINSKKNELFLC